MKIRLFDLPRYFLDWLSYRGLNGRMYWYQRNKGLRWVLGQNFGDYLSFVIVGEFLKKKRLVIGPQLGKDKKLVALGSVMHFANDMDVIWGSGVNGKVPVENHVFQKLDVRMVRGPLTRQFLLDRGIEVQGHVYGDPALLLPWLFPELKALPVVGKILILPNLNELKKVSPLVPDGFQLCTPMGYWKDVVKDILSSEMVITSSLHGLIIAESFGVPVRFVAPCGGETLLKYEDYLEGTGRKLTVKPTDFLSGISRDMGVRFESPKVDIEGMKQCFPFDLFLK